MIRDRIQVTRVFYDGYPGAISRLLASIVQSPHAKPMCASDKRCAVTFSFGVFDLG